MPAYAATSGGARPMAGGEAGELVKGFNEMLDHNQQRDQRLDMHRQDLERTVNERTAELQANVERYRLLVESTHAVPWEADGGSLTVSYISPQATKLFGYEIHDVVSQMSLIDLVHPDDRVRVFDQLAGVSRAGSGQRDVDLDYRVLTAHGVVLNVRSVVTAHRDIATGAVVLRGITLDITRQKKLEMELRQAQKLESVGRLAAGVAHEINTPIQFVSDSVYFVRDAVKDLANLIHEYQALHRSVLEGTAAAEHAERIAAAERDADVAYLMENVPEALERSLEGLSRVATIVRSMKEFAHPDQKEMAAVNLNQAIQSTLTIARNEYKYVADVETSLGDIPLVMCHAGDINQVVLNIVVNAAHAIGSVVDGTDRKGRITVETACEGGDVVIRIGDTGGGIPEEFRERIFDPFFTTKEVGKGTGQGLAIARSVILEKHGGDLTFESEIGKGTTFVIRLPIDGVEPLQTGAGARSSEW